MNQSDFCQYISYYHDFVKFSPKIDDHHEKSVSNLQLKDVKKGNHLNLISETMRQSEESVKVSPQHPYLRNSPSLMGIWPVLFSAVSTDLKALKLSSDPVFQKTRIDYQLFSANSHK